MPVGSGLLSFLFFSFLFFERKTEVTTKKQ